MQLPHEAVFKPGLKFQSSDSPFNALFTNISTEWFVAGFLLVNRKQLYTTDDANQGSQWDNAIPQTGEFFSLLKDNI